MSSKVCFYEFGCWVVLRRQLVCVVDISGVCWRRLLGCLCWRYIGGNIIHKGNILAVNAEDVEGGGFRYWFGKVRGFCRFVIS